jgi:hypothetical protein
MNQLILPFLLVCVMSSPLYAGQSIITEGEGFVCMGADESRPVTESRAFAEAKRNAVESVNMYVQSEIVIADTMLANDLVSAYANARVRILQELLREWYTKQSQDDCCRVKLKVEVIPDNKTMVRNSKKNSYLLHSDSSCPLAIKVWMDKDVYLQGERMKIFIKANKPFFAKVIYKQADGTLLQLLPNQFRDQNYFNGGVVYEIPSGDDHSDLVVTRPFGFENVTVYASTSPLGTLDIRPAGGFYAIGNKQSDVPHSARCLIFEGEHSDHMVAEFAEATVSTVTRTSGY